MGKPTLTQLEEAQAEALHIMQMLTISMHQQHIQHIYSKATCCGLYNIMHSSQELFQCRLRPHKVKTGLAVATFWFPSSIFCCMVALGFLSLPLSPLAYMALSTISCAAWLARLEPFQSLSSFRSGQHPSGNPSAAATLLQ